MMMVRCDSPGIITRLWVTLSGWFWEYWNLRDSDHQSIP
jgi:hypothetical protein